MPDNENQGLLLNDEKKNVALTLENIYNIKAGWKL